MNAICPHCSKEFLRPRKDAVYCSSRCRSLAQKKRSREGKPEKLKGKDLTGLRFGRLLVVLRTDERCNTFVVYECICDCGNKAIAHTGALRSGSKKSCGCLEIESRNSRATKYRKHGYVGTPTYKSWMSMRQRCECEANRSYKYYGAKGISYDARWSVFENFLEDMGKRPEGKTLDRINNGAWYSKENCRWATYKEQARNRTNNVFCVHEGKEMTIAEYAEKENISHSGATKRFKSGRMVPGGAFVKE